MKKIKTKFKNLFVLQGIKHRDKRGYLKEVFIEKEVKKKIKFTIVSCSNKNVLRGMHYQIKFPQDKFITVLKGQILDVVVDLRKKSKTFGKYFAIEISQNSNFSLFIPENFAHGFLCLSQNCGVYYKCSNYRDKKSETTIKWDDKFLNIKWPIKKPILSKKDKAGLSFDQFIRL